MSVSFEKLQDIAKVIDSLHKTPKYSETGYSMVRCTDVKYGFLNLQGTLKVSKAIFDEFSKRYEPSRNDIVITRVGTYGVTALVQDTEFCLGQNTSVIIAKKINPKYLYAVLNSPILKNQIEASVVGSTQKTLSLKAINNFEIPRFSPEVEDQIAKMSSELDEKIHLNNQINQTLESIAQAIFKSWFIDFDPVRAKIAAKQEDKDLEFAAMCAISGKSEEELQQMAKEDFAELQAAAALFPDELVESELGEVPKGWGVNNLGNICNFTPGSAFKPEYQGQSQGDIPFIKVSDMNLNGNEIFIIKANNYIDNCLQKEKKFKLHEVGTTVFAKIGVALISNRRRVLTVPTIIDNNMMSASPLKGLSTPYYLYLLLKTIDFNTLVSGTALPYLNISDLRKISVIHPDIKILDKFEPIANALFQKINLNSMQNEGLEVLRDTLLPRLLTGDLVIEGSGE